MGNVAFALRGLLSKKVKAESKSENLSSSNLCSVLTLISFFLFLPFALVLEGNKLSAAWPPVENLEEIPEKILGVPVFSSSALNYGYELVIYTGFFFYYSTTRWPTWCWARSRR